MNPQPLRVGGALDGWAAREQWARLEYFSEVAGPEEHEQQVQVSCSEDGQYSGAPLLRQAVHMRWGSFARSLLKPDEHGGLRFYMSQEKLLRGPKFDAGDDGGGLSDSVAAVLLEDDFAVPPFVPWAEAGVSVNLWLAAHRTDSALHYDAYHNLLCVVRGSKRVTLYPPASTAALLPGALWGDTPHYAHATAEQLPPPAHEVTLQAGECLFLPEGWWHRVQSEPGTAAVNFWWLSPHAIVTRGGGEPPAAVPAAAALPDPNARIFHMRRALSDLIEERLLAMVAACAEAACNDTAASVAARTPLGVGPSAPLPEKAGTEPRWCVLERSLDPAGFLARATPRVLRVALLGWASADGRSFRRWWEQHVAATPPQTCVASSRCQAAMMVPEAPLDAVQHTSDEGKPSVARRRERAIAAWSVRRAFELGPEEQGEAALREEVASIRALELSLGEGWDEGLLASAGDLGAMACEALLVELVGPLAKS